MFKKLVFVFLVILLTFLWFKSQTKVSAKESKIDDIVNFANSHNGIAYRAGGTTKKGMDCSGLVYTSFKNYDIQLPRSSAAMSTKGKKVAIKSVTKGDLLFFNIARLKGAINHVGLVTSIEGDNVIFIHATTSKGVIYSSLNEQYWRSTFVTAKRIIVAE